MSDRDRRMRAFVQWARANLARLHSASSEEVADEVCDRLLPIDGQLGVEVEETASDQREMIITAFSDPSRFVLVQRIVAGLGPVPGWRFVALKPPRGFDFHIETSGKDMDASSLRFEAMPDVPGGVRLLLDPAIPVPTGRDAEEMAWLLVETGIGEEMAGRIQHLEFGRCGSESGQSIAQLLCHAKRL